MPASPAKVTCWPPIAHPSRVSSARPRVITAARVLSPVPRPSAMPDAMAITFLSAPATSQPITSGFVYTRNAVAGEHVLQRLGDHRVVHGDHRRGGVAGEDLLGQVRAGEHAARVAGQLGLEHLGHPQAGALLEALRQAHHRHPRPEERRQLLGRLAHAVARHAHHQHVGGAHRLLERRGGVQGRREVEALEVLRVAVLVAHLRGHVVAAGPQRGGRVLGAEVGDGRPPRPPTDHGDLHRHGAGHYVLRRTLGWRRWERTRPPCSCR